MKDARKEDAKLYINIKAEEVATLLINLYLTDVTNEDIAEALSRYISPSLLWYWADIFKEASQLDRKKKVKAANDLINSMD